MAHRFHARLLAGRRALFRTGPAGWGSGRWPSPILAPGDPIRSPREPPAPPADGWLRPGWLLGVAVVWAIVCLVALPVAVYVVSYIPWAMIEGHQIVQGWPPGHNGQTLLDLTAQMYNYHNTLSAAHAASSPWWAWPFDLKPVWFYQDSFGRDLGGAVRRRQPRHLVAWDPGDRVRRVDGVQASAPCAGAHRDRVRRPVDPRGPASTGPRSSTTTTRPCRSCSSPSPTFAGCTGARRVAPRLGARPHRRSGRGHRPGAHVAARPAAVRVRRRRPVNAGSAACPAVIPQFVLTERTAALAVVMGVGLVVIVRLFLAFQAEDARAGARGFLSSAIGRLVAAGAVFIGALLVSARLPDSAILTLTNVPVDPIALVVAIPLGYFALQVYAARDARRFVVGLGVAVVAWFAILYPNISALPLPSTVVAAYQGLLPTYLYAFQFPVSTVTRGGNTPIFTPSLAILLVARS